MTRNQDIEAFEGVRTLRSGRVVPAEWNELSRRVIGAAMRVHTELGPGLPEKLYENALVLECARSGVVANRQVVVPVAYGQESIGEVRLDLVVEGVLVVELKAVESIADLHLAQLVSYLRAGKFPLGLLINFHVPHLRDGLYRRLNAEALPP